jgi:ornithine cyclodeaminase/alanine dehydrogenase
VDPDTFARASSIVVDTEYAGAECGDIMAAVDAGSWPLERVMTLPAIVESDGDWMRPPGVSIFKSVGTAVQDLAAAAAVAEAARERGIGQELQILTPKTF